MSREEKLSRRDFLKLFRSSAIYLAVLGLGSMGYGFFVEPGWIRIETVRLKLKRLTAAFSGFRIVQISDIHIGGWMNAERLQEVVDLVRTEKPNVVLITGDFLLGRGFGEDSEPLVQDLINVLSPLANSIPTFAVLGNHDYWTDAKAIRAMLKACNITDLTNTVSTVTLNGEYLHLCGVDDVWEGVVDLQSVLDRLPADGAAILLAHEPDFADESAATERFDLQISGHSHGGQVVIPFVGPPVLPYLGQKYPSGLYQVGGMFQYTNRGVGTGRVPIRLFCPPEITIFHLDA